MKHSRIIRASLLIVSILILFSIVGCYTAKDTDASEPSIEPDLTVTEESSTTESRITPETSASQYKTEPDEPYMETAVETTTLTTEVPVHSHNYSSTTVDPTCSERGYTVYECACGCHYISGYTDAIGHSWSEWSIARESTVSAAGEKVRTCESCGKEEKEAIPKLEVSEPVPTVTEVPHNHSYADSVAQPSCTAEGYTIHACSCGSSYIDSYTEAMGHSWSSWATTKEATIDEEGLQERTCSNCGAIEAQSIAKMEEMKEAIDTSAIEAYGRSYAQSLGFTPDTSLNKGNAGYYPGLDYPVATMQDGYTFISGCVSSLKEELAAANGTIEGCRFNCQVEYYETNIYGDIYIFWCFYG